MRRSHLLTLLTIFTIKSVSSQLNGEFWWLNDKLDKFRKVRPAEPLIEILSDFDNEESAKIIFRDQELFSNKANKPSDKNQKPHDHPDGKIIWPSEVNGHNDKAKENVKVKEESEHKIGDEFVFNFPKNEKYTIKVVSTKRNSTQTGNVLSGEIMFYDDKITTNTNKDSEAQNICTYLNKKSCYQRKGVIYREWNQKEPDEDETVCCILAIQPVPKNNDFSTIFFPGNIHRKPRQKRSEDGSLTQRKFLLLHKLSQHHKVQFDTNTNQKIVTPAEDNEDPYWNIKNNRNQNQANDRIVTPSYYETDDYGDYASELPKPGLVGIYSDNVMSPSSWTFTSNTGFTYGGVPDSDPVDDYDDDDDNDYPSFGYSTIDPRKVTGDQKQKGKPVKFSTVSDITLNAESHTVNINSNPDFQVLQGFKLLNLFRNRSKVRNRDSRRTTTERIDDSREFLGTNPGDSEEVADGYFEEDQLFGECGKAVPIKSKDKGKPAGVAANGSHPWMVLVVLTKRRHNVICYGTLIHPRAAMTLADCVHGTSPRDITVIAGAWDLSDKTRMQARVADVEVHPRYRSGGVENNLAVLHWMRPLKLGTNIHPACLSDPHVGDNCRFYGWGSLDQGIQSRSRWQRAAIRMCDSGKNTHKHSELFCASASKNHVTSLGGSLICDIDGHNSAVGVVVSMDSGYVLMPIRDFGMKASDLLAGD